MVALRLWMGSRIAFASEDALITFRYAANWAHGLGPVFNAGERVLGCTSPPWMAWIALGIRLGLGPLAWARGTLLVADVVTLLAFVALLERHASRTSAWCFAVFFAAWPYLCALYASGFEMGMMIALLASSAWLIDRRHPVAGSALGLLAIFRPEGFVAAAVLSMWARSRDRIVATAVLTAGALILFLYYGSPVPQSLLAKAAIYGTPGPLHAQAWWDWAFPLPLAGSLARTSEGANFFLLSLLAAPAAVAGARALWGRRRCALAGVVAAGAVVWLGYLLAGASYFFWYFVTPLLAWVLLASVGMPALVRSRLVYASLALALAGHWTYELHLYQGRAAAEGGTFGDIGTYVASLARPGETIMLEPIGTIGWRCLQQRILDEVGLVSPEVQARRLRGAGWYADIVAERRPEWLVGRAGTLVFGGSFVGAGAPFRSAAERAAVLAPYVVVARSDTTRDQAQTLLVLRRR